MMALEAQSSAAAITANPAITDLHRSRAKELVGLSLGVGITLADSQALVAAKLAEWSEQQEVAIRAELGQLEMVREAREARVEQADALADLTRRFFAYLDIVEESDSGREFHPVHFSCCRAAWVEDINRVMEGMKKLAMVAVK